MKKSRLTAIFTILCMLFASVSAVSSAEESKNDNPNLAYAELSSKGAKTQSINFISQTLGAAASYNSVTAAGREGWQLKGSSPYLYIDVDDNFAHEVTDGTSFELEIDYYNALTGFFLVEYDGLNTAQKNAHYEFLNKQDKWKTVKIKLDDAVDAYEKATALKKFCEEKLKAAQLKIEKINVSPENKLSVEPLDKVDED